jgi:hypothetical protein
MAKANGHHVAMHHFTPQKITEDLKRDFEERGIANVSWAITLAFLTCHGEPFV